MTYIPAPFIFALNGIHHYCYIGVKGTKEKVIFKGEKVILNAIPSGSLHGRLDAVKRWADLKTPVPVNGYKTYKTAVFLEIDT